MSEISDEIRKRFDVKSDSECVIFVDRGGRDKMRELADRIDAEMVELPRDRDGVPIHAGDVVWTTDEDTAALTVKSITMYASGVVNVNASREGRNVCIGPTGLTHTRPDSFERIADELDEMVDAAGSADDRCEQLANLADRIRRLAKEGE